MADIRELVNGLGKDQEAAFKANLALTTMVMRATAPDAGSRRAEIAKALAAELSAMAPAAKDDKGKNVPPAPVHNAVVRGKLARLIGYVGGVMEVPALVEAMKDLDVRESARQALEMNASEEAVDALVAALDEVGPVFLVGVVNSLARRKSAKVVPALQKAASSADADVRMAAIEALTGFADSSSDALIVKATQSEDRAEAGRAQVARIRLAETLRAAGDRSAAGRIFRAVLSGSAPTAQKKAARTALAAST